MKSLGTDYGNLVKKKVIRSRDVIFGESEVETADDRFEKSKKKNGIVPNIVTSFSSSNHLISAESTIDEVV